MYLLSPPARGSQSVTLYFKHTVDVTEQGTRGPNSLCALLAVPSWVKPPAISDCGSRDDVNSRPSVSLIPAPAPPTPPSSPWTRPLPTGLPTTPPHPAVGVTQGPGRPGGHWLIVVLSKSWPPRSNSPHYATPRSASLSYQNNLCHAMVSGGREDASRVEVGGWLAGWLASWKW